MTSYTYCPIFIKKKTDQQSRLPILLYRDIKQEKCVGLLTLSNRMVVQIH